ncbi:MAG: dihydroxy-acid dehydratase [Thermomicrobiales bacterium]
MLYRNLAAMDTEEMIRAQPLDGVVALVNCDKTTPAALMGLASADLPAIVVSGGPALNGHFPHNGQTSLGACSDCRRFTAEFRAGTLDADTYRSIEDGIVRSIGHCMVMGTASTMGADDRSPRHRPWQRRRDPRRRCPPLPCSSPKPPVAASSRSLCGGVRLPRRS